MTLATELGVLEGGARPSPLDGFEHVRGYGVMAAPFDSDHVLALRVFPVNDFAPYVSVWHRTPDGAWSIYVDGPRLDTACPRYFGTAADHTGFADIALTWSGPMELHIEMRRPELDWTISMRSSPLTTAMNAVSSRLPDRVWRSSVVLRSMERSSVWGTSHCQGPSLTGSSVSSYLNGCSSSTP